MDNLRISLAASCAESIVSGDEQPLCAVKKAGNSLAPTVATVTPCVSCRARSTVNGHMAPAESKQQQQQQPPHYIITHSTRNSSVRGISRMLLTPAHTTATGVRPSSVRSAEISMVASTPRCTPPIPPVTNTLMPTCDTTRAYAVWSVGLRATQTASIVPHHKRADRMCLTICARYIVAATVVAPLSRCATTTGRSRRETVRQHKRDRFSWVWP